MRKALTLKYDIRFGVMGAALKLTGRKRLATLITKSWSVSVSSELIECLPVTQCYLDSQTALSKGKMFRS